MGGRSRRIPIFQTAFNRIGRVERRKCLTSKVLGAAKRSRFVEVMPPPRTPTDLLIAKEGNVRVNCGQVRYEGLFGLAAWQFRGLHKCKQEVQKDFLLAYDWQFAA